MPKVLAAYASLLAHCAAAGSAGWCRCTGRWQQTDRLSLSHLYETSYECERDTATRTTLPISLPLAAVAVGVLGGAERRLGRRRAARGER